MAARAMTAVFFTQITDQYSIRSSVARAPDGKNPSRLSQVSLWGLEATNTSAGGLWSADTSAGPVRRRAPECGAAGGSLWSAGGSGPAAQTLGAAREKCLATRRLPPVWSSMRSYAASTSGALVNTNWSLR